MSPPARYALDAIGDLAQRASAMADDGARSGFIQDKDAALFAVGLLISAASTVASLGGMTPRQVAALYRQCAEEALTGEAVRHGEELSEMAGDPS